MSALAGGIDELIVAMRAKHAGAGGADPLEQASAEPIAWESVGDFLARADAMPEPEMLVPDLVPGSGRLEIVAEPNAGKTWQALIISKAAGELGRKVFLVLEEGGPKPTANRLRSMKFDPTWGVSVSHLRTITLTAHVNALCADVAAHPDPVVIFDPWVCVSGNAPENDTDEMKIQVALLERVQRANPQALVVVCHHASRAGASGGSKVTASRGSTVLPGWADVILYLEHVETPHQSGQVSFDATVAKNRNGERDHTCRVTISLGDGSVTYAQKDDVRRSARERESTELAARVLALLKTAYTSRPVGSQGVSREALREALGVGKVKVNATCASLVAGGCARVSTKEGGTIYVEQDRQDRSGTGLTSPTPAEQDRQDRSGTGLTSPTPAEQDRQDRDSIGVRSVRSAVRSDASALDIYEDIPL